MNQVLCEVFRMLEDVKGDNRRYEFVKNRLLNHYGKIEQAVLCELESKDYDAAKKGMEMLLELNPMQTKYKIALDRLRDKGLLCAAMENNGLPKSSPLFQQHYGYWLS